LPANDSITARRAGLLDGHVIEKCHTRWNERDAVAQLLRGVSAIAALLTPL
jgi:hypothetical protein